MLPFLSGDELRIALADDSGIFRTSLCRCLEDLGASVVVNAASAPDLLSQLTQVDGIEAAIIDVAMPESASSAPLGRNSEGVNAARVIRSSYPHIAVLLISAYPATPQAMQLLRDFDRGVGYLSKNDIADVDELKSALERVMRGEMVVDRSIVERLLRAPRRGQELSRLTNQERQVLRLMAEGFSNRGIAQRMYLASRTVEDHIYRIFYKLDINETASRDENKRVLAVLTWLRLANEVR